MRVVAERAHGSRVETLDGIKSFDDRGWTQVLPDPDEPIVHLYAEGADDGASVALIDELQESVEQIMEGEEAALRS
jgi:mannose-1-phosphate guanylyltransferase/phosphomannomutase